MATKVLQARVPEELHRRIKVQAALAGRNIEEIVEEVIRDWLADVETSQGHPQQEKQS